MSRATGHQWPVGLTWRLLFKTIQNQICGHCMLDVAAFVDWIVWIRKERKIHPMFQNTNQPLNMKTNHKVVIRTNCQAYLWKAHSNRTSLNNLFLWLEKIFWDVFLIPFPLPVWLDVIVGVLSSSPALQFTGDKCHVFVTNPPNSGKPTEPCNIVGARSNAQIIVSNLMEYLYPTCHGKDLETSILYL